jgi:hypothetical protein
MNTRLLLLASTPMPRGGTPATRVLRAMACPMRILPVLLALSVAGCSGILTSDDAKLRLTTDEVQYDREGQGVLVLSVLRGKVGPWNILCRPLVERLDGTEWQVVGRIDEVCTLEGGPGYGRGDRLSREVRFGDSPFAAPGEYRFRIIVIQHSNWQEVPVFSNSFIVH